MEAPGNSQNNPVNILIADDHPIFRHGVRTILEAEPDFRVVGEAKDGKQALELAAKLNPSILLMDLAMPGTSGLEALRELTSVSSPILTIILTAAIETPQIVESLQLGARGIILKDSASSVLVDCIRAVLKGQHWVGQEKVSDVVQVLHRYLPPHATTRAKQNFGLTPRELEVVAAVVAGYTNSEIAHRFKLSEQTIKHHITNIFDKLGVSNRMELALFAVTHRLEGDA